LIGTCVLFQPFHKFQFFFFTLFKNIDKLKNSKQNKLSKHLSETHVFDSTSQQIDIYWTENSGHYLINMRANANVPKYLLVAWALTRRGRGDNSPTTFTFREKMYIDNTSGIKNKKIYFASPELSSEGVLGWLYRVQGVELAHGRRTIPSISHRRFRLRPGTTFLTGNKNPSRAESSHRDFPYTRNRSMILWDPRFQLTKIKNKTIKKIKNTYRFADLEQILHIVTTKQNNILTTTKKRFFPWGCSSRVCRVDLGLRAFFPQRKVRGTFYRDSTGYIYVGLIVVNCLE